MSYLGDPRENSIDIETGAIWESDNMVEERFHWGAAIIDLCDLPVEEYMKNPIVEAINNSSSSTSEDLKTIVEKITVVSDGIKNVDESVGKIGVTVDDMDGKVGIIEENITAIKPKIDNIDTNVEKMAKEITDFMEIQYYTLKHSLSGDIETHKNNFHPVKLMGGNAKTIFYILGDPKPEDWEAFEKGDIDETEYRKRTNNDYWISIPSDRKINEFTILENGNVDVSDKFIKQEGVTIKEGYTLYVNADDVEYSHVNDDFPDETDVEIEYRINYNK